MFQEKLSAGHSALASCTATVDPARGPEIGCSAVLQARHLVQQAAELALTIRQLAVQVIADQDPDADEAMSAVAIRELAGQLGWMADLAAAKLGGHQYLGDASAWMTTPAFREVSDRDVAARSSGVQQ